MAVDSNYSNGKGDSSYKVTVKETPKRKPKNQPRPPSNPYGGVSDR